MHASAVPTDILPTVGALGCLPTVGSCLLGLEAARMRASMYIFTTTRCSATGRIECDGLLDARFIDSLFGPTCLPRVQWIFPVQHNVCVTTVCGHERVPRHSSHQLIGGATSTGTNRPTHYITHPRILVDTYEKLYLIVYGRRDRWV